MALNTFRFLGLKLPMGTPREATMVIRKPKLPAISCVHDKRSTPVAEAEWLVLENLQRTYDQHLKPSLVVVRSLQSTEQAQKGS